MPRIATGVTLRAILAQKAAEKFTGAFLKN
jgi:hypothetical protein